MTAEPLDLKSLARAYVEARTAHAAAARAVLLAAVGEVGHLRSLLEALPGGDGGGGSRGRMPTAVELERAERALAAGLERSSVLSDDALRVAVLDLFAESREPFPGYRLGCASDEEASRARRQRHADVFARLCAVVSDS